jgi:hypothetical protein
MGLALKPASTTNAKSSCEEYHRATVFLALKLCPYYFSKEEKVLSKGARTEPQPSNAEAPDLLSSTRAASIDSRAVVTTSATMSLEV